MPRVTDNAAEHRFELSTPSGLAMLVYSREGDRLALVHTEVPEAEEGAGLGSQLARAALDAARRQGLRVIPTCPFVRDFVDRHPEYGDLVDRSW